MILHAGRSRCTAPACACSPLASATRRTHLQHALAGATPRDKALPVSRGLLTTHHARWQATQHRSALEADSRPSKPIQQQCDRRPLCAFSSLLALLDDRNEPIKRFSFALGRVTVSFVVGSAFRAFCILHFCIFAFSRNAFLVSEVNLEGK